MSKVIGRAILNSALLTFSALITAGINFLTIFALTRFFSQENFGAYVSSQAKVGLWLMLVDLGLYNGVVGTLTAARASNNQQDDPGKISAILRRSFLLRLLGATLGFAVVLGLAYRHASQGGALDHELFLREIAFSPFLFGYACQQNLAPYLAYSNQQPLAVMAHLATSLLTAIVGASLAAAGAPVAWVLFTLSLSGLLAAAWVYAALFLGKKPAKAEAGYSPWQTLFLNSWPYALIFVATTVWQRLDQVKAASDFGLVQGGEYGLAARLVGIPIVIIAATSVALFPDFQRTGTDAPEKLRLYISLMLKLLFRYGLFLSVAVLGGVAVVMALLFPKYEAALHLLPWFVPGIWAFALFNFANNGLLGARRFPAAVISHLAGLLLYLLALYSLPATFALRGVALAYDSFCAALFLFTFISLRRAPGWEKTSLFAPFSGEERVLLRQLYQKARGRFR